MPCFFMCSQAARIKTASHATRSASSLYMLRQI
jgi:hypothetical protein